MTKAKDLCQQLCDSTKDASTKADLKAKMAALDKDVNDTVKKLGNIILLYMEIFMLYFCNSEMLCY